MTRWEKFKFNVKSRYMRIKYKEWSQERQEWNRQRINLLVKDVIENRNPYNVWGISIPADYLTEWELRYALKCTHEDHDDFSRWFHAKVDKIIEDLNNE